LSILQGMSPPQAWAVAGAQSEAKKQIRSSRFLTSATHNNIRKYAG